MPLINCELNLMLTWSANCVICKEDRTATFLITDTKLYVTMVTLSALDNFKLLKQSKLRLNRSISWNK